LEKEVPVIKLLLEYDPDCFRIRSPKSGHTALDIHIISMSRLLQQEQPQYAATSSDTTTGTGGTSPPRRPPSCTSVVKALTEHDLGTSVTKSCLELLLSCNSLQVMEHVAREEAHSFTGRLRDRRHQRASRRDVLLPSVPLGGSRNFHTFWVWEFVLTLLKSEHQHTYRSIKPVPPFNALHTASCIPDFPLPFLMLCMRAYPTQMRMPDPINSDLPLHSVAAWEASDNMVLMVRKSMTLTQLVYDHPTACRHCNRQGKTALSLALETGTSWDHGVRQLTAAQKDDDSFL
jgi:hypothetical protein